MKKLLISLGFTAIVALTIWAQQPYNLTLGWTENPAYELVSGYRIEYQKLPSVTNWSFLNFVGTTNKAIVTGLQPGYVYKFRIFAVNGVGVGTNLSNVVQIPTNAPSSVLNFGQQ